MIALLLRRRAFARLWLGGAVSMVGDWLTFVAVSLFAVERGGGALALAGVLAAHMLPGALVSPLAGVIADRFDRRRLLMGAALVQGALTVLMALAAARGSVPLVQALLLFRGIAAAFVPPAEAASLRGVVEKDELLLANAVCASTWSVSYVGGMALGGALALLGPTLAIALDGLTFAFSAALVATLPPLPPPPDATRAPLTQIVRVVAHDLKGAVAHTRARPGLARAVLAKSPVAVAAGTGWLALNLRAEHAHPFGAAALSLGVLQAVRGTGTGVGPAVAATLVRRGAGEAAMNRLANLLAFGGIAAFAVVHAPWLLLAAAYAWGTGAGANWVLASAAIQRQSDPAFIGRLAALDEMAVTATQVASAFAGAVALETGHGLTATTLVAAAAGVCVWGTLVALTRVCRSAMPVECDSHVVVRAGGE